MNWSRLPDMVLINIYLHLPDPDRLNMALTCTNWNRIFSSPCLWRTRCIEMGGYRYIATCRKVCKFGEVHSKDLQYLCLSCNYVSSHCYKSIQNTMNLFLQKIHSSRLLYLDLQRMNTFCDFWRFVHMEERVSASFSRFLSEQRCLQTLKMGNWHFSVKNGCRILEAVGSASGSSIKELDIEDFFHTKLAIFQVKRFRYALVKFTNLSFLSLNGNCLSNSVLESMATVLAGKLKSISCAIYRTDAHVHVVSGESWRKLKSVCPGLALDLYFGSFGVSSDINWILVPEAPLRKVHISAGFDDRADVQLALTIDYIANYHKQIAILSIDLDSNNGSIGNNLVSLVTQCRGLRELYVNAFLTVGVLNEICTLQTEGKIDLQTFYVRTHKLTEGEFTQLVSIKEKYLPVMHQRGFDFKISCDYLSDLTEVNMQ